MKMKGLIWLREEVILLIRLRVAFYVDIVLWACLRASHRIAVGSGSLRAGH